MTFSYVNLENFKKRTKNLENTIDRTKNLLYNKRQFY